MKKLSPKLQGLFLRKIEGDATAQIHRDAYLKWLRFYLDYCAKYDHRPRDSDSLAPFLEKLSAKGQSAKSQEQAAASIGLFYELVEEWKSSEPKTSAEAAAMDWEQVYEAIKQQIKLRQYSPKTLKTYVSWVRQFQKYLKAKPPLELAAVDAEGFLTHLAVERKVVASTQNQAFHALLFLYRHILKADYDLKDKVVRARRTRYIPVVLSRAEVDRVLAAVESRYRLVLSLMYGCGLRLNEALNLRVQCLNFDQQLLTIHNGKGGKDRTVPLPQCLLPELSEHLVKLRNLHERDLSEGYAGVFMPGSWARKGPGAAKSFPWQWLFPAVNLTFVPDEGAHRRYHLHDSQLQKALRHTVREIRLTKRVTSHIFRHSFATHLLQVNVDIETIRKLLGHANIQTTMVYLHTARSRTRKDRISPLDIEPDLIDGDIAA